MENKNFIICPVCNKQYRVLKTSHINSHDLSLNKFNELFPNYKKVCENVLIKKRICDKNYRKNNKQKYKTYFSEYYVNNRDKKIEYQKNYKKNNIDQIKESQRKYAKKNRIKKKQYDKLYRDKNADKLKIRSKIYRSSKNGKDKKLQWSKLDYKNKKYMYAWRRLLYFHLRRTGQIKTDRTHKLLKYSYNQLKQRIECQFKPGMSWKNYGEWHIDHKKPLSSFPINTPPHITNALCNLQPLWSTTRIINGIVYVGNLNKNNKF